MAKLPRREVDVLVLCDLMISGYRANPEVFPSADVEALEGLRAAYQDARGEQTSALARAQAATDSKYAGLDALIANIRRQAEQSESDTADEPERMALIGLAGEGGPAPSEPPAEPRALAAIVLGPSTLLLDWKSPAPGLGGKVHTYIVERREKADGDDAFSEWQEVDTTIESEATLTRQPSGVRLEYRVMAQNPAGRSAPSKTTEVSL